MLAERPSIDPLYGSVTRANMQSLPFPRLVVCLQCCCGKRLSVHANWLARQAGAYTGFSRMKRLGVFQLRCSSIAGLPPALNSLLPIYILGWREALLVRVKCLAQEHKTLSQAQGSNLDRSIKRRALHRATLVLLRYRMNMSVCDFVGWYSSQSSAADPTHIQSWPLGWCGEVQSYGHLICSGVQRKVRTRGKFKLVHQTLFK